MLWFLVLLVGRVGSLKDLVKLNPSRVIGPCYRPLAREGWLTKQKEAGVNQEMTEMVGMGLS